MKYAFTTIKIFITSLAFLNVSCSVSRSTSRDEQTAINSLKFIGEYELPYNKQFKGTTIGGLSGIDYDAVKNVYYLVSDDRSNMNSARFYTAAIRINETGIDSVEFVAVTSLQKPDGSAYVQGGVAIMPDPEALRFNPRNNTMIWTSEGERVVKKEMKLLDPQITTITPAGKYVDTFPLPYQFHIQDVESGPRQNGVFEGLAFADNFKTLYISTEVPLYNDGPEAGLKDTVTWARIIQYDIISHRQTAQYAWALGPIAHPPVPAGGFMINGVPDILSAGGKQLLIIERSFSTGIAACTIHVYLGDLSGASDIKDIASLQQNPPVKAINKKLLLDMDSLGIYTDNVEGITFGPNLPNGHRTLLFVADNNFSAKQKTQFLLFEVL